MFICKLLELAVTCSSAADFPKFLGICMETFIMLIDDSDVDVKMVADECLNRMIRVRISFHIGLIQLLYAVLSYENQRCIFLLEF